MTRKEGNVYRLFTDAQTNKLNREISFNEIRWEKLLLNEIGC
jgi:hypothetical protein